MEVWKDIIGYEGLYKISTHGRVKSLDKIKYNGKGYYNMPGKYLKLQKQSSGYLQVQLTNNEGAKHHLVHRLVADHFIVGNKKYINHRDGNKSNNNCKNLERCTPKENTSHAVSNGLFNVVGENHPQSKLTDDDVRTIKVLVDIDTPCAKIAEAFGVAASTVYGIKNGDSWKHINI